MRRLAIGVLLASSAASAAPKGDDAELLAAINKNDAKAATALVESFPLLTTQVWFDDGTCREKFDVNVSTNISEEDFPAWVRCMSKLGLHQGQVATNGVAWWTFDPGIALRLSLQNGKLLAVVGRTTDGTPWVGRKVAAQHLPARTLRVKNGVVGGVVGGNEGGMREGDYASAEICITPAGAIDAYMPGEMSDPGYGAQIRTAAKKWKFKPFLRKGHAIRVCASIEATDPADKKPPVDFFPLPAPPPPPPPPPPGSGRIPNNVPPNLLESVRTAGEKAIRPDADTSTAIVRSGKEKVIGSYKMCLDETGAISLVSTRKSTGFPGYDATILDTIKTTWKYKPYVVDGKAIRVCTAVTFIYSTK